MYMSYIHQQSSIYILTRVVNIYIIIIFTNMYSICDAETTPFSRSHRENRRLRDHQDVEVRFVALAAMGLVLHLTAERKQLGNPKTETVGTCHGKYHA